MGKKAFEPESTRNIALVGHRSAGKTSLGEWLLHRTGATRNAGSVVDGTSLLDHARDERIHHRTLSPAFAWLEWREYLIHLVDTPGSEGNTYGRLLSLAGADSAVVVVSGAQGVELGTESAIDETSSLPSFIVINKVDRLLPGRPGETRPSWRTMAAQIEERTATRALAIQLPVFDLEGDFIGVVCLVERVLHRFGEPGGLAIPAEMEPAVDAAREALVEAVALASDELLERYLEFLELPVDDVRRGLSEAIRQRALMPVMFTAAVKGNGIAELLNAVVDYGPAAARSDVIEPELADHSEDVQNDPVDSQRGRRKKKKKTSRAVEQTRPFVAQWIASLLDDDNEPYHVLRVRSGSAPNAGRWVHPQSGESVRVRRLYQIRGPRRTTAVNTGAGAIFATWDALPGRPGDTFTNGADVQLPVPPPPNQVASLLVKPGEGERPERFEAALQRILSLDPGLRTGVDPLTKGTLLIGYSAAHLSLALDRLRRRFDLTIDAALPPVAYRESPTVGVHMAHGVERRNIDGVSTVVAEVWFNVEPRAVADGFRYVSEVDEFVLPERYVEAAGTGALHALTHGPLGGYPVVGLEVRCVGGDYNVLESTVDDFQAAGRAAMDAALEQSASRLLEPWSTLRLSAPSESVGGLLGDITSHRGRVVGMEMLEGVVVIMAEVPDREFQTFPQRLEALTHGRGGYTRKVSSHEPLPPELVSESLRRSPLRDRSDHPSSQRQRPQTRIQRGVT